MKTLNNRLGTLVAFLLVLGWTNTTAASLITSGPSNQGSVVVQGERTNVPSDQREPSAISGTGADECQVLWGE